jgi:hypothetical protein
LRERLEEPMEDMETIDHTWFAESPASSAARNPL